MGAVAKFLVSPVLALAAGAVKKPKPAPVLPMARPQARAGASTALLDAVAARRGSRANQRTGRNGAEPTNGAGSKTALGA